MTRNLLLLAMVLLLGLATAANADANGYGPGTYQDDDGDGTPNCHDDDYIAPEDCLQYQYGCVEPFVVLFSNLTYGGNGGSDGESGCRGWGYGEDYGDCIPNEFGDCDGTGGECPNN